MTHSADKAYLNQYIPKTNIHILVSILSLPHTISTMKYQPIQDHPRGKIPQPNSYKRAIFLILFFILITSFPFCLKNTSPENEIDSLKGADRPAKTCDVFNGTWVPYLDEPYYTNETCHWIIDQQNCLKFGRPDREFLKWRWKPDDCELPLFDAVQFLELVRGKSLAFLGDSVGKNQMHSLVCLLTKVRIERF